MGDSPVDCPLDRLPDDWRSCLVVVAHPDDVEYGAACAVAQWTSEGKRVSYLLLSRGEAGISSMPPQEAARRREAEQRDAARLVGVDEVEFLDHPDGLIEYGVPLRRDIALAIRRHRPDMLLTLTGRLFLGRTVNMADHRAVGLACLDATRDAANGWLFADSDAEAWSGVRRVLFAASPEPTHAVDVSAHLPAGIASLRAHRTYLAALDPSFDPETFLREQTAGAGRRVGCAHAVAFEVVDM